MKGATMTVEDEATPEQFVLHCIFVSWSTSKKRLVEIRRTGASHDEKALLQRRCEYLEAAEECVKSKEYARALGYVSFVIPGKHSRFYEAWRLLIDKEQTIFQRLNNPEIVRLHLKKVKECLEALIETQSTRKPNTKVSEKVN
jgi:hypothetical protein